MAAGKKRQRVGRGARYNVNNNNNNNKTTGTPLQNREKLRTRNSRSK
jgi:hypothetical protein